MEYFFNVNTGRVEQRPIEQNNNLPFNVGGRLFDQFNNAGAMPNITTQPFERFLNVPRGITTISPGTGVPGVLEPDGNFRMIPGYIDRNTNIYRGDAASSKEITDLKPLGFDTSFGVANEEDVEQEFLPDQKSGIAKLFEFLQKFSPVKFAARGIGSFFNPKASDRYMPSKFGIGQFTADDLNRMNALGGYYSDPARAQRRARNRVANMLKRKAAGKSYSEKNLQDLQNALSGSASMANYASPELASKSSKVGVSGFKAGDDIREQASTSSKYGF